MGRIFWTALLGVGAIIAIFLKLPFSQAIIWVFGVVVLLGYTVVKIIRS